MMFPAAFTGHGFLADCGFHGSPQSTENLRISEPQNNMKTIIKLTRAQRKARKAREMFWNSQPDIRPQQPKGRVKSKGRAQAREFRNMDYRGGEVISIDTWNHNPLGSLNSTSTRVVGNRFVSRHTGRTWLHRHAGK